jgi:hypothetical protein
VLPLHHKRQQRINLYLLLQRNATQHSTANGSNLRSSVCLMR